MRKRALATILALGASLACTLSAASEPVIEPKQMFQSIFIPAETSTVVEMSNTDVNRITCPVPVTDVVYSVEKGVNVRFLDREVFVKFLVIKKGNEEFHATQPTEFYVVCGEAVYTIIAQPRKAPPRPIRLLAGKGGAIEENRARLQGLPLELKLVQLVREAYSGTLPETYSETNPALTINIFRDLETLVQRIYDVEGEGLRIKELSVTAGKNKDQPLILSEKLFASNALGPERKLAVAIEKTNLKPGESTRVILIEQKNAQKQGN